MTRWTVGSVALRPGVVPFVEQLPPAILALGPVAYWKMEEGSGTVAIDSTGNGHTGTYSADVAWGDRIGATGHDVPNFWKASSKVTVPSDPAFSQPNDTTVLCLAQQMGSLIGATPSGMDGFFKGGGANWEYATGWPSFHSIASEGQTGAGLHQATEDLGIALTLAFKFFVWQFPASGAAPIIYVENVGPLGSTSSPTGTRQGSSGSSLLMGTGHGNLTSHSSVKGRFMCHAAIYDRLLTPTEMSTLYAAKVHDWP